MGHERVGYLPKTKKWRAVVRQIGEFTADAGTVSEIADQTTKNVISRFGNISKDSGVLAAFKFLILFSHSAGRRDPNDFLKTKGIDLSKDFSLIQLSKEIKDYVEANTDSKEYSAFANNSLISAFSQWAQENKGQKSFDFSDQKNSFDEWRGVSGAGGFCELTRSFFANFIENYLKYFLQREASARIENLSGRDEFDKSINKHVVDVSKHAFETAKITQSFAAGWFNKNVRDRVPTDSKIQGFISYCFQKINSEMQREKEFDGD